MENIILVSFQNLLLNHINQNNLDLILSISQNILSNIADQNMQANKSPYTSGRLLN